MLRFCVGVCLVITSQGLKLNGPEEPEDKVLVQPQWMYDQWVDPADENLDTDDDSDDHVNLEKQIWGTNSSSKEGYYKPHAIGDQYLTKPYRRVIVLPKYKLAFCWIEKNGCKEFNELFNNINGLEHGPAIDHGGWGKSDLKKFELNIGDITHEKGWTWAAFFRDPIVRYASAFQSKCMQAEDHGNTCEPPGAVAKNLNGIREIRRKFAFSINENEHRAAQLRKNPHYGSQTDFCGGAKTINYDFIGLLEGNVNEQVTHMLNMVHVQNAADFANHHFPPGSIKGHHSKIDHTALYHNNTELQDKVAKMYAQDMDWVNDIREKHFSKEDHVMLFEPNA